MDDQTVNFVTTIESHIRSYLRDRFGSRRIFSGLLLGTSGCAFVALWLLWAAGIELHNHQLAGAIPAVLAIILSAVAFLLGGFTSTEFTRESMLLSTLEETPDLIAIHDPDGRAVYRNPAFHKFLNRSGDSLESHPHAVDAAHEWSRAEIEGDALPRAGRGETWRGESVFKRFDGKTIPVSHIMVGNLDPNGVTIGTISIARDITEQKMIEATLRDTQNSVQKITESTPSLVYIYDITMDRVVYCNQKVVEILGYSQEELYGSAEIFAKIVHPMDMPHVADGMERLGSAKDGEVIACEFRARKKDGEWLWLTSYKTPCKRDDNGHVYQLMGSMLDITSLKQAQDELRRDRERFKDIVDVQTAIIAADHDWHRLIAVAVEGALAVSRADGASLVYATEFGYETKCALSGEFSSSVFELPQLKEAVAECFRTGCYQECSGITSCEGLLTKQLGALSLPIFREDTVVAVIQFARFSSTALDKVEIDALSYFANIVSEAFHRAWSKQSHQQLVTERVATLDRLQESEEQFRAAVEAVHEALVLRDRTGKIRVANKSADRILGFPTAQLFEKSYDIDEWAIVREDRTEFPIDQMPDLVAIQTGLIQPELVIGIERMDGTVTWLSVSAAPLFRHGEQNPYAAVMTFSDISERKAAFEANARLAAIVDSSQDGIIGATLDGIIVNWNPGAEHLFGYTAEEIVGSNSSVLFTPNDTSLLRCIIKSLMNGDEIDSSECVRIRKDGSQIHVSITYSLIRNANLDPIGFAAIVRDVTERKRYEQQIQEQMQHIQVINSALEEQKAALEHANVQLQVLAMLDGLTGLNNHRVFQDRLQQEFKRARRYNTPLSMFILDVDEFKNYNDQFGHPAGDEVLKIVANILTDTCRSADIVARYGGEEFVVILPQTHSDGAIVIADRCRAQIEKYAWKHRPVTASFGVNTMDVSTVTAADFVSGADQAMYRSKRTGKNKITHASEMDILGSVLDPLSS